MVPLRVSVNRTSSGQRNSPCAGTQVEGPSICQKNTGLIAGSIVGKFGCPPIFLYGQELRAARLY